MGGGGTPRPPPLSGKLLAGFGGYFPPPFTEKIRQTVVDPLPNWNAVQLTPLFVFLKFVILSSLHFAKDLLW